MWIGLWWLFWSAPMKIMLPIALAGLLTLPTHVRAEPAVDCGSFPNSQMRLTCWNDTSRALQADLPGQRSTDPNNAAGAPVKPKAARTSTKKPVRTN
jgi:hypothetical protein